MAIFVLLFFVSLTLGGIEQRDWVIALLGAIPLVFAIIAASIQIQGGFLRSVSKIDKISNWLCRK